jgi:hypothetical protein
VGQHATVTDPYGNYARPTSDNPTVVATERRGTVDDLAALRLSAALEN